MSLASSDNLQETNIKWLGKVPSHWHVGRFRHHFRESPEKIDKEVVGVMLSVSGYRGIEIKEYDDENRRRTDEELVNYRIVRVGQLVVNSMWLNAAGLGVSDFEGHVSPAYRCYWIGEGLNLRYVHHLLRSAVYVDAYTSMAQGIRPNSLQLSRTDLMNLPVLIPAPDEQISIANFLDAETAKIDALVAEQRRLIELLKEKRQAVISHAVTKGLNPNAPMKPSGIQWLGDVPEHWGVLPLHRIVEQRRPITYGIVQPGAPDESGRYMIRNQDFTGGWVSADLIFRVSDLIEKPYARARMKPNDLIMTIVGAVGSVGLVPNWLEGANTTQNLARIAIDQTKASPFYVAALLRGPVGTRNVEFYSKGAVQSALNLGHIKRFWVTVPPLHEQNQIVEYLNHHTAGLDGLESEAERAIDLLQERRTALISAAVTGKIDVRNHAPLEVA